MTQNEFIKALNDINVTLTQNQLDQLNKYYELLVEYNKVMNLTGITEKEEVYLKHFYDSLTIIKIIDLNNIDSLCDIGTGAGFPGLVLKIVFPNLKITLLDSLNKRIEFLKIVINELGLKDIEVIHTRAEEYALNNRNKMFKLKAKIACKIVGVEYDEAYYDELLNPKSYIETPSPEEVRKSMEWRDIQRIAYFADHQNQKAWSALS